MTFHWLGMTVGAADKVKTARVLAYSKTGASGAAPSDHTRPPGGQDLTEHLTGIPT